MQLNKKSVFDKQQEMGEMGSTKERWGGGNIDNFEDYAKKKS